MISGYLSPAQHAMLKNTPTVRLHVGLPSVRQIIPLPSGYAIHYSQYLAQHIQSGAMSRGPNLDIDLHLFSPNVIGMLVFIFLTGSIGGWPSGSLNFNTQLDDVDSAHEPPMDETPKTGVELVFEVCRVGGSLLMKTDIVDSCAERKLGALLAAGDLPRDTVTVEQAAMVFNRNQELAGMKRVVAKWFARDLAVEAVERERMEMRGQTRGLKTELDKLYESNNTFACMVDYCCDRILAGSKMGKGGKRVAKDLISGKKCTLMEGGVWREIDQGGARL